MIVNRLVAAEYNDLDFVIDHTENGEACTLPEGSRYYMMIARSSEPVEFVAQAFSEDKHMHFDGSLSEGEYIFELGIITRDGNSRVILPALDEKLRPMNQIIVLRRLKNAAVQ